MVQRPQLLRLSHVGLVLCVACKASAPSAMSPDGTSPSGAGTTAFSSGSGGFGTAGSSPLGSNSGGNANTPAGPGSQAMNGSSGGLNNAGASGANGNAMHSSLDVGNYFASGTWMGYVWTSTSGAGSTISPMDFAAQTTGMPRCVKGTVAAESDYSGTAVLGVNLSEGMGATSTTVTPTKAGVLIDISNHAASPLRFQVKSAMTGGTEWCTPITGSGGFIPWTSLRTNCWDTTGTPYNREPIASAMILVPGTNTAPVAFDFCWNSIVEADGPAGGSAGSGPGTAGTGTGTGGVGSAGMGAAGSGTGGLTGMTVPPVQNGCDGYATRYWDCCKPHCGWTANSPAGALASCDQSGQSLGGNADAANACTGGTAYLCSSNTPWAVSDRLAYGFAAVAAATSADVCGKCYQLDFTGSGHTSGSDPGAAALAGKTMIVQAINIGGDVGSGQFDLAIPGGGVGAFNACSTQWNEPASSLGPSYGGFLAACQQQTSDHQAQKSCVMSMCTNIFQQQGRSDLYAGCQWFVDWFEVADNPSLKYAEVACPSALTDRGIHRSGGGGGCL